MKKFWIALHIPTDEIPHTKLAEGVVFDDKMSFTRLYGCNSPVLVSITFDETEVMNHVRYNDKTIGKKCKDRDKAEIIIQYEKSAQDIIAEYQGNTKPHIEQEGIHCNR